jgi:transcriptional regulator with XRE-family HTH domain
MADIESMAQNLGSHIRQARQAYSFSQNMLGIRCNVGKAQISKVEKDVTHASMELFLKICEVLKIDISLRQQPKPQAIPTDTTSYADILSKLSLPQDVYNALEKRARTNVEKTTNPFHVILPNVHREMLRLLEDGWTLEAEKEPEAELDEELKAELDEELKAELDEELKAEED